MKSTTQPPVQTKRSAPVRIADVKRGKAPLSERTVKSLEAKIANDPRWRED